MAAKNLKQQAESMLRSDLELGQSKKLVGKITNTPYKKFTSVRSFKDTVSTLARVATRLNVKRIKHITANMAVAYLLERKDSISSGHKGSSRIDGAMLSQKTLDAEKKALSIALKEDLPRIYATFPPLLKSRTYTIEQIAEIANHQSPMNSLATRLALDAGLRAKELLTIQPAVELSPTKSREWLKGRFEGRSGVRYVVKGKGGLVREVLVSNELSVELEQTRRPNAEKVVDRGVNYLSYYMVSGGNKFSKSFSDVSKTHLGFSNGAHGLRHMYVQQRMKELYSCGKNSSDARLIVSQEVGHFRPNITNVYLR